MKKKKAVKAKAKPKRAKKEKKVTRTKVKPKAVPKAKKAAKIKRKTRKTAAKPLTIIPPANGILLGRVEDYFAKIGVMALTLQKALSSGDHLHILGHTTNLEQPAESMQIDHQAVTDAAAGSAVGIKVTARVRRRDYVYLIPG